MPRVPMANGLQVAQNTLPQVSLQPAQPARVPDIAGRQAEQLGQSMQRAGTAVGGIAQDMVREANQFIVNENLDKVKNAALDLAYDPQTGFTNLKGAQALYRPDDKSLDDEYGEKLQQVISGAYSGLKNDAQRAAFTANANDILTSFRGQAMRHASQEYTTYGMSNAQGMQSTAMRDISLNWNNPSAVASAVERIQAATYTEMRLGGKSPEWQQARARDLTSAAHKTAIMSALQAGSAGYADAYLRKFSGEMNADDILAVHGHITKEVDGQQGLAAATNAMNRTPLQVGEAVRAFNVAINTESGGRQFQDYGYGNRPDGTPKGPGFLGALKRPDRNVMTEYSVGVEIGGKEMDIPTLVPTLTKPEINTLLNIEPGEKIPDSIIDKAVAHAKERIAQGKSVFKEAEPLTSSKGAVGIAQVMPATGPEAAKLAGLPWDEEKFRTDPEYNRALGLAYFQKQLQDFGGDLSKAYAAYNAGPGATQTAIKQAKDGNWLAVLPKETQDYVTKNTQAYASGAGQPPRPTLEDLEAKVRSDPSVAGNPERLKIALTEVDRQYKVQSEAIQQQGEAAVATALRGLVQNGGRFSELPISVRAAIPPDKLTTVMSAADRFAKGDDTTSLWLYNKLSNEPNYLAGLSDDQFYALRTSLSAADFKHFSDARAKARGVAAGTSGPGDLNSTAIKMGVDSRLRMMGMDPTPKDGSDDAARVGAIRKFIDGYMLAAQREAGKKFSDADVEQQLDALFMKSATAHGWFSNSSVPILSMKVGDIDGSTKDGIKAALKRRGIDAPTDAMILNAFWNLKTTNKVAAK